MKKKIFCFVIIAFLVLVSNFAVNVSYIMGIKGFSNGTIVYLPSGKKIMLAGGEEVVVKGFKSCEIHDHVESSGWHIREQKAKRKFTFSLRKTEALPIPKFWGLAILMTEQKRRTKVLIFSPELLERTYPGRPPSYYLSAHLKRNGFSVVTIDVDIAGRNKFIQMLQDFQPDIVAGTSLSVQINEAMELLAMSKKYCPKAISIVGGTHATAAGKYLFPIHPYLNAAVAGDGLKAMVEIAEAIESRQWDNRKAEIQGLIYWDGKDVIQNEIAPLSEPDLFIPEIPYHPSYNFSVLTKLDGAQAKTFQLMTAFGCENHCLFCNSSTKRGKEKRMKLNTVEAIIRQATARGYEAVYFDDDTFTRDIDHAVSVARLCKKYGLLFGCHTRPDCENEYVIRELVRCGCRYMFSGLESAVDEILLGANKTTNPVGYREAYMQSYKLKRELGLPVSAYMVHGMPRKIYQGGKIYYLPDRLEDSKASIDFALWKLDPTFLSMNILRLLPEVPFSKAQKFKFMWPVETQLHGGCWDKTYLEANGISDPRSFYPMLRAFEGSGSCIPRHVTTLHCYQILDYTVKSVNAKNSGQCKNQTRIIVDPWFEQFLIGRWVNGVLSYELAPFEKILLA